MVAKRWLRGLAKYHPKIIQICLRNPSGEEAVQEERLKKKQEVENAHVMVCHDEVMFAVVADQLLL